MIAEEDEEDFEDDEEDDDPLEELAALPLDARDDEGARARDDRDLLADDPDAVLQVELPLEHPVKLLDRLAPVPEDLGIVEDRERVGELLLDGEGEPHPLGELPLVVRDLSPVLQRADRLLERRQRPGDERFIEIDRDRAAQHRPDDERDVPVELLHDKLVCPFRLLRPRADVEDKVVLAVRGVHAHGETLQEIDDLRPSDRRGFKEDERPIVVDAEHLPLVELHEEGIIMEDPAMELLFEDAPHRRQIIRRGDIERLDEDPFSVGWFDLRFCHREIVEIRPNSSASPRRVTYDNRCRLSTAFTPTFFRRAWSNRARAGCGCHRTPDGHSPNFLMTYETFAPASRSGPAGGRGRARYA